MTFFQVGAGVLPTLAAKGVSRGRDQMHLPDKTSRKANPAGCRPRTGPRFRKRLVALLITLASCAREPVASSEDGAGDEHASGGRFGGSGGESGGTEGPGGAAGSSDEVEPDEGAGANGGRAGGPPAGGAGGASGMGGGAASGGGGASLPGPIQNGCQGYATRFWDCCKPHCGWPNNVGGGGKPVNSCGRNDAVVADDTQSSCQGGNAHMCYTLTPWRVSDQLAYGFAATSQGDVCGRCFQLQFTGRSHNGGDDPGSKALLGKTMIVQAVNIGYDVSGGQFDIAIPGGGVGAFNACSAQWGVSNEDLGAQYGGFLSVCRQRHGNNHGQIKTCVSQRCSAVFQSRGLDELAAGCRWFVEWFQAADNPDLKYKEVSCPQEIVSRSGMRRGSVENRCGN